MPTLEDHPDTWHRAKDEDFLAAKGKIPGFFPIDKPVGWTSRQAVDHVKEKLAVSKAGHTGTLDPFADGVLLVAVDEALKVLKYTEGWDKVYEGAILLGIETDSYDITGNIVAEKGVPETEPSVLGLAREKVEAALARFVGEIIQKTPPVSAARVRGERLYERARRGERLSPPRVVDVHSIEVTGFELPRISVRVHCGRGTYIRSIAHELGEALGTGAVLESLRRIREGPFTITDCVDLVFHDT